MIMKRSIEEALRNRRSYYAIGDESPVSYEVVEKILDEAPFGVQFPVDTPGTSPG